MLKLMDKKTFYNFRFTFFNLAQCPWGILIFSYIRRLESFLGDQNFEFQYLFFFVCVCGGGGGENIFGGMKILWIFWGSFQSWTSVRGYFHVFYVVFS